MMLYLFFIAAFSFFHDSVDSTLPHFLSKGLECPNGVTVFFKNLTIAEIDRLALHSNPQVAIYSYWMAQRRRETYAASIDQQRLLRANFCGFVTGRLNIVLPDWWVDFYQAPEPNFSVQKYADVSETGGVRHKKDVVLTKLSHEFLKVSFCGKDIEFDRENIWDRSENFSGEENGVDCLSVGVGKDGQFVLVVLPIDGSPTVFCIDKSGRGLWESKVRKCRQIAGVTSHSPRGLVDLDITEEKVAVFWRNECEVTLDVFDLYTGAQKISFTTLTGLENGKAELRFSENGGND